MEELEVQQSTMRPKDYTVRIIPKLTKKEGENGDEIVAKYLRRTNPSKKSREDGKVKPTNFFHLELFSGAKEGKRLGGDTKPRTIIIFENTDSLLFESLAELEADDNEYRVIEGSKTKPKVLNESLPGLFKSKKCSPYYATRINADGKQVKLTANKKQPNGDFEEEAVVLESVTYFLHENDVNKDADEIAYIKAVGANSSWLVKANADSVEPKVDLDKDEETEETVK